MGMNVGVSQTGAWSMGVSQGPLITKTYTKEDITPLPSGETDLANAVNETNVVSIDSTYDVLTSAGKYAVFQIGRAHV